jgi:hypothetical protein
METKDEIQHLEEVDSEQAKAFEAELAELDRESEPDYDPEAEEAAKEQAKREAEEAEAAQVQAAEVAAWGGIVGIEKALQTFVHKRFKFSDEEKQYAVEHFAPFLIKYGASAPSWLGEFLTKYAEEIAALKGLVVMGKGSIEQIKQLKEEDRQAEEAAKKEAQEAQSQIVPEAA